MRRISAVPVTAAALGAALLPPAAFAEESAGDNGIFRLGLRAVYLSPQSSGDNSISGKLYPEIDGEWSLGGAWSTEIAMGAPTDFSSRAFEGAAVRLMPITWTAKYRFAPDSSVHPYLGAGVQYTRASLTGSAASNFTTIDSSTFGVVAQAGLEVPIASGWCASLDVRYLTLEPGTGTAQGASGQRIKIDPFLLGAGVSYRW